MGKKNCLAFVRIKVVCVTTEYTPLHNRHIKNYPPLRCSCVSRNGGCFLRLCRYPKMVVGFMRWRFSDWETIQKKKRFYQMQNLSNYFSQSFAVWQIKYNFVFRKELFERVNKAQRINAVWMSLNHYPFSTTCLLLSAFQSNTVFFIILNKEKAEQIEKAKGQRGGDTKETIINRLINNFYEQFTQSHSTSTNE